MNKTAYPKFILLHCTALLATAAFSAPSLTLLRDSLLSENALLMGGGYYGRAINGISYQEQILYTFDGYQYSAFYDTSGDTQRVVLARRAVDGAFIGEWETYSTDSEMLNGDEPDWNAHNVISFGISESDGTLHLAWDHHNHSLRYRKSIPGLCTTNKEAWGEGMLGPEQSWLVDEATPELDVTYPQFTNTPDGGLVFNRRFGISGNGDQYLQTYDPASGTWQKAFPFISRSGTYQGSNPHGETVTANERCAYINGIDFDQRGQLHVTWTWRESARQFGNRDICYAFSPDLGKTWYNNDRILIADTTRGETITTDSPGITVVPLDMRQLMINQQTQCVEADGTVHVLMLHRRQDPGHEPSNFSALFSTKSTAYYHYFRHHRTGQWQQRRIPPDAYPVGSRPRLALDAAGNLYAAYLSYPAGTEVFPGYREDDDRSVLVIATASQKSGYSDWQIQKVIDKDFDGEPLIDTARLLKDGILSVYIQEHGPYPDGPALATPLHVYDFQTGRR